MSRAAVPALKRPAGKGESRASRLKHLELLAHALGWTSSELARAKTQLDAAHAAAAKAELLSQYDAKVLAWSRAALERKPEAIESPRLTALAEVAEVARDVAGTDAALERALELLQRSVRFENATFFLYDRRTETLVPRATRGGYVDLIPEVQFDLGQGLSSWIARARRPVLLSELRGDEESESPGTRPGSFLSVPLVVAQDLVGVLNVGHSQPGAFTEADRDLLAAAGAILSSILARQAAWDEARRRSITDELTGLANRAHFVARIEEEIEKAKRYGHSFALVVVDPLRFASINDMYGRPYGDSCLVALAALLRSTVRKSDLVGRLAPGDEFGLLLPHQGTPAAREAAARIKAAVDAHAFPRRRRLSASVGVAGWPEGGADAETLLARAAEDRGSA